MRREKISEDLHKFKQIFQILQIEYRHEFSM